MYDGRPVLLGFSPLGNFFRRREAIMPPNFGLMVRYELLGPHFMLIIDYETPQHDTTPEAYRALCVEEANRYR
jgi:hypothetical protein